VFDWLFEGRTSVYAVLIALTVLLGVFWWQTRKRWCLIGVAIALGLIGLYAILDATVETDREQIVRKIRVMIAAVNAHDVDAAFQHISDDFRTPQGKRKEDLRELARRYIDRHLLESVDVWDIACIGEPSRADGTGRAAFMVKTHGPVEKCASAQTADERGMAVAILERLAFSDASQKRTYASSKRR